MSAPDDLPAISLAVWESKYRARDAADGEHSPHDTFARVARALAAVEGADAPAWREPFADLLRGLRFLPGGRILAGAGSARRVTLFNCFVMGAIDDSMTGILDALREGALTMQQGGGVGYDFSTLRPRGVRARRTGGIASGPVSFLHVWDSVCATLLSTSTRRGAMMATLRCDHPDILEFVSAKRTPRTLSNFNLSVLVSDAFMDAVRRDEPWPLVFPSAGLGGDGDDSVLRTWSAGTTPERCRVFDTIAARSLWYEIVRGAYESAEPGVLFVDRINDMNNLGYRERISATNPCGEVPLPPYGACNLGSLNVARFVREPFSPRARVDLDALAADAALAVRMLDDVIDASRFPLDAQAREARGSRRIGLGVTGLADAFVLLGMRYDDERALTTAGTIMECVCRAAYGASVALAAHKGSFPYLDRDAYLARPFVRALPAALRDAIARDGIRNSHLTAIAPAGTISLLAGAVSSGVEPIFAARYRRAVLGAGGERVVHDVEDYACRLWRQRGGDGLPPAFVDALRVAPESQLAMQAVLQRHVDAAVSKTVNVPAATGFDVFRDVFERAYALGLKGCTAFRANPATGDLLHLDEIDRARPHCCHIEREAD